MHAREGLEPAAAAASAPKTAKSHTSRTQLASGVAFAPDGALWLVGLNAQKQLFVQHTPPGQSGPWSAPRVVANAGDAVSANGEAFPKLAFGPKGWVVISYTQPLDKPYTGFIRMLRSSDGGKTFSAPFTVHADRQIITHSFESIAFDDKGVLHTSWVDKRDLALALGKSAAAPSNASAKAGPESSYRGAAIYRNESVDGGATFGADIKLADHSCECCRIAMTPGADGQLRILWRQVFEPNVRDHAFASLAAGSARTPPVRATQDDWRIDACPHHGPGLALASDKGFHAVWFGIRKVDGQDQPAVRYGRLNADGTPRLDTVRALPDAHAEHADVLADGNRVAIVWRSVNAAGSQLRGWLSTDGGQTFALKEIASTALANDQPRLARQGRRMVAVWRNSQEVQVHELQP